MSQYTEQIQKVVKDFQYLDDGKKITAIEGAWGKLTTYYKHGGTRIQFLTDCEFNGVQYKKDQVVETPPTDEYYQMLDLKYNGGNSSDTMKKIKRGFAKICSMLKF